MKATNGRKSGVSVYEPEPRASERSGLSITGGQIPDFGGRNYAMYNIIRSVAVAN